MTDLPIETVQDYPRPPAIEPIPQTIRVVLGGVEIARSARAYRILETHHAPSYYIPRSDWQDGVVRPARGSSFCEWKGRAVYWDLVTGGTVAARAAWSYPSPSRRYADLINHLACYAGEVDEAWVGETRVLPQPGDFYGGWVTPNLQGIVKGGRGTEGW